MCGDMWFFTFEPCSPLPAMPRPKLMAYSSSMREMPDWVSKSAGPFPKQSLKGRVNATPVVWVALLSSLHQRDTRQSL